MTRCPRTRASSSSAAASPGAASPTTCQARLARRRAAGAARAVLRHHLACRRARRPAARQPQPHAPRASTAPILYERLEAETGQATGFRRPGSLSVARTAERMHELKRCASMARCFGVDVEVITPAEAGRRWPLMRTDDLAGAVWLPGDGRTNPIDTTLAMARGRAQRRRDDPRERDGDRHPRVSGAPSPASAPIRGDIACEVVVNCAGMWGARGRARWPASTCRCTPPSTSTSSPSPWPGVTRRPAGAARHRRLHLRARGGRRPAHGRLRARGQAVGHGRESRADFTFSLLPEDWEHFRVLMEQAIVRIPALETAPVRRTSTARRASRPTAATCSARRPSCRNFFVAAGFNSVGIASAAGAGKAVAEWIVGGEPPMDLWDVDIRRFAPFQGNAALPARAHAWRWSGALYAMHWPFRQPETARGVRKSRAPRSARRARRVLRRGHGLGARRTGSRRRAMEPRYATATGARTGSPAPPPSIARCARPSGSSTSPRSPSSGSRGRMPPPTLAAALRQRRRRARRAASSTRRCSTAAAASSAT